MNKQIVLQSFYKTYADRYKVYPSSTKLNKDNFFFMVKDDKEKYLVVGAPKICKKFEGESLDELKVNKNRLALKIAYLNHYNLILLREIFPYLSPSVIKEHLFIM